MSKPVTTAERLGEYRRELEAEGFDEPLLDSLVMEAARRMMQFGIVVKSDA